MAKKTTKSPSFSWSLLPIDLVISVAELITDAVDFVRLRAVCKPWRTAIEKKHFSKTRHMPWLMLPEDSPELWERRRRFYSPSEDKIYEIPLPEARERFCCGSSEGGWIATVGLDSEIHLLNPFLPTPRNRIQLPSLKTFNVDCQRGRNWSAEEKRDLFIAKIFLSSNPLQEHSTALAFYGSERKLALARLDGGDFWITVTSRWWPFADAIFYKDRFYVVNYQGIIVALEVHRRHARKIAAAPFEPTFPSDCYLVESAGDLLQVLRVRWPKTLPNYRTITFFVYRLDLMSGMWEEVDSLGDKSLFLGFNNSMSVVAPDLIGCRANCIYFTDDNVLGYCHQLPGGGHDMGVFSLEDKSIQPHYSGKMALTLYSPALWVPPLLL